MSDFRSQVASPEHPTRSSLYVIDQGTILATDQRLHTYEKTRSDRGVAKSCDVGNIADNSRELGELLHVAQDGGTPHRCDSVAPMGAARHAQPGRRTASRCTDHGGW